MMTLHDKHFELYISDETIQNRVRKIAKEIDLKCSSDSKVHFIIVLNGAFMFASDLLKSIHTTCEISFIKLSSYDGMESSNKVRLDINLNKNIKGEKIIIIEDIIDTGNTVDFLLKDLSSKEPVSIEVCSLLYKPNAFKKNFKIDYIGFEIPNDFVVGYGLDYNQLGRNLKDLYVHKG